MAASGGTPPITAIIYEDGAAADELLSKVARHLVSRGVRVAGFVQDNVPCENRPRCDMVLEELATGERVRISEDRGEYSRGCRLDVDSLLQAESLARRALEQRPQLLVVNKFGKNEAMGGGFRPLIGEAMARGVPILIVVATRNLDAWREFTAGLSADHPIEALTGDVGEVCGRLGVAACRNREADARSVSRPATV